MHFSKGLIIEYIDTRRLRPYPRNARTHSRKQIRQIADSIDTFGFTNPILIDEELTVLCGHGRLAGARLLGMQTVPCVKLSSMTAEQKRAYVLADNKLALNAGWDEEILAIELEALSVPALDFSVEVTGFSVPEIETLIDGLRPQDQGDPADERLPAVAEIAVSRPGDLWVLGEHKLLCGDCRDAASFQTLLGGERAEMVFTDPPYNVPIDGHVSGLGRQRHREFAMASGEMTPEEFTKFLNGVFQHLARFSADGSIHYICMDWRHIEAILSASKTAYSELKNLCVWAKDNGGMGSFYRSRHELVFVFKSGMAPHINNFELGQHGRYRTNVWNYRGMSSRGTERQEALALHPTVKPVALVADAIKDVSRRNGIVLDCFAGSGSTLIAAHKTARRARLIEIDPLYVDRIIRRWEIYAKDEAVLEGTQRTFSEVSRERLSQGRFS
jgi:DNA modification methylase